jgi:broad specificity phosphatase PhoE
MEVSFRLDGIIAKIREMQKLHMHSEKGVDVVLLAHGHILRSFAKRWIGFDLEMRLPMSPFILLSTGTPNHLPSSQESFSLLTIDSVGARRGWRFVL